MAAPLIFFVVFGLIMIGDGPFVTSAISLATGSLELRKQRKRREASAHLHHDLYASYHEGIPHYYD